MADDVTELLCELVRADTSNPPGNEERAAAILRNWLAEYRIETSTYEVEPGRPNVVATVRGAHPGKTITFNTHMDVVPAGEGWSREPFLGEVHDGVVFGRGSTDAKGSLAAMAGALAELAKEPEQLPGNVQLAAVADEEVGSAGARELAPTLATDGVIVGEPTKMQLMTAHKGSVRPIIEIRGKAAHAARPASGINALEAAAGLLQTLSKLRGQLARRRHPELGVPTIVPVLAEAGEAANMVPERCRITLDRRLVPPETETGAVEEIEAWLDTYTADHAGISATIVEQAPTTGGASETPATSALVRACQDALRESGYATDLGALTVNCDMSHFRNAGIPAVIWGPGSPDAMHVINETLSVKDLRDATRMYSRMARAYLRE